MRARLKLEARSLQQLRDCPLVLFVSQRCHDDLIDDVCEGWLSDECCSQLVLVRELASFFKSELIQRPPGYSFAVEVPVSDQIYSNGVLERRNTVAQSFHCAPNGDPLISAAV